MEAKSTQLKKICSLLLILVLLISIFQSAYAEDVIPEITATEESGHEDQLQNDLMSTNDTNSLEEISEPVEATESIEATESVEILSEADETSGTIPVTNYEELIAAVEMATEGTDIIIANDIVFTGTLIIDKSLNFMAMENAGTVTLSSPVHRHMKIMDNGSDILLSFKNVILDGAESYGGIYVMNESDLTLTGAVIQRCSSNSGGGIYIGGNNNICINDCIIRNNRATTTTNASYGGGIWAGYNCSIEISNTVISNNQTSVSGGGICSYAGTRVVINGGEISENHANFNGGGIYNYDGSIECHDAVIKGNSAGYGGGICGTNITFNGGEISGNTAINGGGIYSGGTVCIGADARIAANQATLNGGGIWISDLAKLTVTSADVVFFNNKCTYNPAYIIDDVNDIALHNNNVNTAHATAPFKYVYNNYDVVYTKGTVAKECSITVRYEDADGNVIAPEDNYTGMIGQAFTITPPVIPGYQSPRETTTNKGTYSGTYTEDQKTIVFRYTIKSAAFHGFFSFALETSETAMTYKDGDSDYRGNVIYYPDAGDTLTGTYAECIWSAYSGQSTQILYFPQKQLLGGIPQLTVYSCSQDQWPYWPDSKDEVISAGELASKGYWISILYSTDQGKTFSEAPPEDITDTNAIGIKFIMANNATPLAGDTSPLWITAEFPITIDTDKLTEAEANGTTALKGWKHKGLFSTFNLPAAAIISSPQISGTVRQQELSDGEVVNWDQAGNLDGQTVELLDENGNVIAITTTDENGEYTFSHINAMGKLQVRIKDAGGTVYFADADAYQQKDTISAGRVSDIDRILERFINVTWKNSDIDRNAANSQNARFIVATRASIPSVFYTVMFDSQGGSTVAPITGVIAGSIISAPISPIHGEYDFAGWYKEPSCMNEWDFENDTVTSNITLYAKWTSSGEIGGSGGETGSETGVETGSETGVETGNETGVETGSETGVETGNETGGETGNETGGSGENGGSGESNGNGDEGVVIIDEQELPKGSGELDDVPKTGETGASWIFYASLMLASLIVFAILLIRRKESI